MLTSNLIFLISYVLTMLILLVSFLRVRNFFLRFHPAKFEAQKTALWVYFVFDLIHFQDLRGACVLETSALVGYKHAQGQW